MNTFHMIDSKSEESSFLRSNVAIAVPVLAAVSVLLCMPPLVSHIKSHNLAASMVIFWIALENLFNFINPLIWPTDDIGSWWNGAGLCDIQVKLVNAAGVAIPGALTCLFRQLAIILNTDQTVMVPSQAQRKRRLAVEILLCLVVPVYIMIAHYAVQPYRYYIFAIGGCVPTYDNSWVTIVLIFIWPVIIIVVDAIYCGLVIYRLIKYRRQFSAILSLSQSFNKSRFWRLFALSATLIVFFLPVVLYIFVRNVSFPRHAYSWSQIHGPGWSHRIAMVPSHGSVKFDRWVQIAAGYVIFLFFGFGNDATLMYRSWLRSISLGKLFPNPGHLHFAAPSNRLGCFGQISFTKTGSGSSQTKLVLRRKTANSSLTTPTAREDSSVSDSTSALSSHLARGPVQSPPNAYHVGTHVSEASQQQVPSNHRRPFPWHLLRPEIRRQCTENNDKRRFEDIRMAGLVQRAAAEKPISSNTDS